MNKAFIIILIILVMVLMFSCKEKVIYPSVPEAHIDINDRNEMLSIVGKDYLYPSEDFGVNYQVYYRTCYIDKGRTKLYEPLECINRYGFYYDNDRVGKLSLHCFIGRGHGDDNESKKKYPITTEKEDNITVYWECIELEDAVVLVGYIPNDSVFCIFTHGGNSYQLEYYDCKFSMEDINNSEPIRFIKEMLDD